MRRLLPGLAAALVALAACASPAAPAPPPPPPAPTSAPAPSSAAAPTVCTGWADSASTLRAVARALEQGPVLPAGVALFLLDVRSRAAAPAGTGTGAGAELAAAQAELVAAIDDLDAQGRAGLPPGGNPAQDAVRLDPARISAAVERVERACAAA